MKNSRTLPVRRSTRPLFTALAATFVFFGGDAVAAPERVAINEYTDYLRIENVGDGLDAVGAGFASPVLIVDLRYVGGDASESESLGRLFSRHAIIAEIGGETIRIDRNVNRPDSQLTIVLVNGETSGELDEVLAALQAAGDAPLVGSATEGGVVPALLVTTDAEIEKAAYLAFADGTSLSDLLDAPVEKKRYDEALLLSEFDGRSGPPKRPDAEESETAEEEEEPPLVDRTLQRAVNTAIALKALGKI